LIRVVKGFGLTVLALAGVFLPPAADARVHSAPALEGGAAAALAAAAPRDTVLLGAGVHRGPLRIAGNPVVLRGAPGAIVDAGGHGSAIEIGASGTIVEDLEVRRSGSRVLTTDAGVRVIAAQHVKLLRLRMRDVLYGVYGERAESLEVRDGDFHGRVRPLDEAGEGNGIHLWYCSGVTLRGNRVSRFLDGIYLSFAHRMLVEGQILDGNGRYGLHTMYCQDHRLVGNRFTHNLAGVAIMFSNRLVVEHNRILHNRGPRTYGLLLRDCSDGVFRENALVDNTVAVFLDGSNRNQFRNNLFQDNGWGVLLFSSSADNVWAENDFIHNDYPVALDMRRTRNQFDDGRRGNYWSEAETYDLDGDGRSDVPHGPVTAFAFVSKQYPDLAVLAKSPAVAALGVAERVFPTLRPSEAVDRFPALRPVSGGASPTLEPRDRARPAWGYGAGFAVLGLLGLWGVRAGRRP
jgi:nitrous oxidase accessory protein